MDSPTEFSAKNERLGPRGAHQRIERKIPFKMTVRTLNFTVPLSSNPPLKFLFAVFPPRQKCPRHRGVQVKSSRLERYKGEILANESRKADNGTYQHVGEL